MNLDDHKWIIEYRKDYYPGNPFEGLYDMIIKRNNILKAWRVFELAIKNHKLSVAIRIKEKYQLRENLKDTLKLN